MKGTNTMKLCYNCMHQIQDEKLHICPKCGKPLKVEHTSAKYLKPGTVLQGKFVVGNHIGAGGFGNTYIGWNQLLLRKVAIKEFYPEQYCTRAQDGVTLTVTDSNLQPRFRSGLQQFLEEARSVAALQDIKGVVEISNFFEENGTGYIVMEYLEGMDVKHILKRSGQKKDYEWCRRVILTVLHTLREIHKRGVLHRDIAPDNIFVTNEGVIKLIDFGAAKHASALANMRSEIVLKVGYAPIEQYSRKTPQGPYTDLYAVAALFYRMLTGQKPIPANERVGDKDALIPPSEMGVQIPEQAEMGIMVCLNVKPEYRLQSADDFMEVLDGKYFRPVYEPEWILPPVEEPKGAVFRKISALPVAAKAAICFGGICLIGGLLAGGIALNQGSRKNTLELSSTVADGMIRMEDFTGKKYDEVVDALKREGFENIAEPVYDYDASEEGTIIYQNISPAEEVSVDTELILTVSGGDRKMTMPDFSGQTQQYVVDYFAGKNFDVEIHEDPHDKTVKKQNAASQDEKKAGKIIIQNIYSDSVKKGTVVDQTIASGDVYNGKKEVYIQCSFGKKKDYETTMPNLKGMSKAQVKKALKKAKLSGILNILYREANGYSGSVPAGCIERQSIAAGEKLNLIKDKDRRIGLYLSKGLAPTPKPTQRPVATHAPSVPKKSKKKKNSNEELQYQSDDSGENLTHQSM